MRAIEAGEAVRQALVRLNPSLPSRGARTPTASSRGLDMPLLVERNRALHRMLMDRVAGEYRRKEGSIAGA